MRTLKFVSVIAAVLIMNTLLICQTSLKWYAFPVNTTETINCLSQYFAAGNNGKVFRHYMYNWNDVSPQSNVNFYGMLDGIVAGENGKIFRSTNNGKNWSDISIGENVTINCLKSLQTSSASFLLFAIGNSGRIFYSTNNGINWTSAASGTSNDLKSILFSTYKVNGYFQGIIAGRNGTILVSTNSGMNWSPINTGLQTDLNALAFSDNTHLYAAGDNGVLMNSPDFGHNWNIINLYTYSNFKTISFSSSGSNPPTGWGLLAGDNGACFISPDFGSTWSFENTGFNCDFKAGFPDYSSNKVYLSGTGGKILVRMQDSLYNSQYDLSANNIRTRVYNDGVFNQNLDYSNSPGFEWPKDSSYYQIFTSGINICAKANNRIKMASASFRGEYVPGYCANGYYLTDSRFKLYRVRKNENPENHDYANWYKMVPFGAPYFDRNRNGVYDQGIDIPGMKGADETVFICLTDADPSRHNASSGFGGGTPPLNAEVHFTIWAYDYGRMKDVNFMKIEFINKSPQEPKYIWDSTYFSLFFDFDVWDSHNNYMGCDSARNMAFGYVSTDSSSYYGKHPPAVGMSILKGLKVGSTVLKSTSAVRIHHNNNDPIVCEREPESNLTAAYNVMRGRKNDGTKWVIPNTNPPQITKYTFSGDPETGTGWVPSVGRVSNCNDSITGAVLPEYTADKRAILSSGADNLKIMPGDTQVVYAAQFVARGFNNLNSVTRLKELCDSVLAFYEAGFPVPMQDTVLSLPSNYYLSQNYPNPFNAVTKIKFELPKDEFVTIKVYDVTGRLINTIVSRNYTAGRYEITFDARSFASGVYFYRFESSGLKEVKKMVLIK